MLALLISSPARRRYRFRLASVMALALVTVSPALVPPADASRDAQLAGVGMPFLQNEGQMDAQVAYYALTFTGMVFVTRQGEIVYALAARSRHSSGAHARDRSAPVPGWSAAGWPSSAHSRPSSGNPGQPLHRRRSVSAPEQRCPRTLASGSARFGRGLR